MMGRTALFAWLLLVINLCALFYYYSAVRLLYQHVD